MPDLDVLPEWAAGTVAILATGGDEPHAIPVSTILRDGPRSLVFALSARRESLARLRSTPDCGVTVVAAGVAFSAYGRAEVAQEPLATAENMVALRLVADRIQDHANPTFALHAGVDWEWTDPEAADRDATVRAGLKALITV